jgi:hypothetical protein
MLPAVIGISFSAQGRNYIDSIYLQAEKVRWGKRQRHVDVLFLGRWYVNLCQTWAPQDADPDKATVSFRAEDGLWYKLWFWQSAVESVEIES